MSRSIRSRLDRLERQREEQPAPPAWDAIASDWPAFCASVPVTTPTPEQLQREASAQLCRDVLRRVCEEHNVKPADLGLLSPGHAEARRAYNPEQSDCSPVPLPQPESES